MADKNITPRSVFKINLNEVAIKGLSISTWLGTNTVNGDPTMAIYDSDNTDVTDNFGKDVSYSSSTKVITFGVLGYATGTYTIVFTVVLNQTAPDGSTAGTFTLDLIMVVGSTPYSATAATAEQLETFALSSLDETKIALKIALGTTTDDTLLVHLINNSTYLLENMAKRRFYATDYTNELYDGSGTRYLFLRNYPINTIDRVALGKNNAIRIKNSASYTTATVSVTSSAIVLKKDGTTDATLTFASNTTMTAMVTAINAVGNNWSGQLVSNNYANYQSSELLKRFGANAISNQWVDLEIPDDAEDQFEVYEDEGYIYYFGGFPKGHKNIIVTHNSGYSTIPYDIREGCNLMVKEFYDKAKNTDGNTSERIGNYSYTYGDLSDVSQKMIGTIILGYRRIIV